MIRLLMTFIIALGFFYVHLYWIAIACCIWGIWEGMHDDN